MLFLCLLEIWDFNKISSWRPVHLDDTILWFDFLIPCPSPIATLLCTALMTPVLFHILAHIYCIIQFGPFLHLGQLTTVLFFNFKSKNWVLLNVDMPNEMVVLQWLNMITSKFGLPFGSLKLCHHRPFWLSVFPCHHHYHHHFLPGSSSQALVWLAEKK